MDAFLVSTGAVTLAEFGDKTQLLALVLAAKYRKPLPIIFGILVATLANHLFAAAAGAWFTAVVGAETVRWIVGLSFFAMAGWALVPDRPDAGAARFIGYGAFLTTLVAFFIAEMGDKTQVATVVLAAKYPSLAGVVAGTTLGMLIANVPAVVAGDRLVRCMPISLFRLAAALIFGLLGAATLLRIDEMIAAA